MEEIPQDLIAKILLLLPVKTLLCLRSVSKSLCSFIDSPDFINSHLLRSITHNKIIIRRLLYRNNPVPVNVFDIEGPFHGILPPLRRWNQTDSNCFFAHCNGLVVLDEDDCGLDNLVVWNPSTRKCRKLPVLPKEGMKNLLHKGVCFGYDSSIDDYKVLVMKESKREPKNQIWILGLRSGYWRRIEMPSEFRNLFFDEFESLFVDGAFYLLSTNDVILAFDLAKETFSRVSTPDLDKIVILQKLGVLEGLLCLRHLYSEERLAVLYGRKKNDEGEFSWSKLFSINFNFQKGDVRKCLILMSSEVLRFSKDGDKIYLLCDQNYVFAYDFKANKVKLVVAGDKNTEKVFGCTESLVWVEKNKSKSKKQTIQELFNQCCLKI